MQALPYGSDGTLEGIPGHQDQLPIPWELEECTELFMLVNHVNIPKDVAAKERKIPPIGSKGLDL